MGNACDCFKSMQGSSSYPEKPREHSPSDRRLTTAYYPKDEMLYHTIEYKKNGNSESSISYSFRADAKGFSRRYSITQGSNFGYRRATSSIIQSYLDTSSIIIINPRSTIQNKTHIDASEYYTLIDKIAFVKKTADRLRVTTPAGSSYLNCQPHCVTYSLFIAEGVPLETLPDVNSQKSYVQMENSPIKLMIKLSCLECRKKIKLTYCKAYVNLYKMKCPKCDKAGKWSLLDIYANAPIWGYGRKIYDHYVLETAPTELRLIGCVLCFRFSEPSRKLDSCDCYVCKDCDFAGDYIACPICNAEEDIL